MDLLRVLHLLAFLILPRSALARGLSCEVTQAVNTLYHVHYTGTSLDLEWSNANDSTLAFQINSTRNHSKEVLSFNATHLLTRSCEPIIKFRGWTGEGHMVDVMCFANCSGTPGVEPEAVPLTGETWSHGVIAVVVLLVAAVILILIVRFRQRLKDWLKNICRKDVFRQVPKEDGDVEAARG